MARNVFNSDSPSNFKNLSPERHRELQELSKQAKQEIGRKRKEMQDYIDFIGNSTINVDGVEVPRNFLVVYKLYEKALAGNDHAIKLLMDATTRSGLSTEVIANIIKLKID